MTKKNIIFYFRDYLNIWHFYSKSFQEHLLFNLMTGMQDSAKITQVESDQKTYMMALERYRTLAGQYPSDQQGLMALVDRPTTAPRPRKWSSMMDRLKEDPWGNPYIYKFPGSKKKNQPEIISWGEDGLEGTVDDLSSQ
ncbi:MAG TPA: type II secretion system protein GspG [Verrucomicrobiales bacterium]|nr:type II secretion system protein GspG [Verrucomicrobiales bacterium]